MRHPDLLPQRSRRDRRVSRRHSSRYARLFVKIGQHPGTRINSLQQSRFHATSESPERGGIWDALALAGGKVVGNEPGDTQRVTNLLVSVVFPLRESSTSPAWPILEQAAHRSFNKDAPAMMEWAMRTYGLQPDASRPEVAR